MANKRARKAQPRIAGVKRIPASQALHPRIEQEVTYLARRHNISKSWVRAVAMAHGMGIKLKPEEEY